MTTARKKQVPRHIRNQALHSLDVVRHGPSCSACRAHPPRMLLDRSGCVHRGTVDAAPITAITSGEVQWSFAWKYQVAGAIRAMHSSGAPSAKGGSAFAYLPELPRDVSVEASSPLLPPACPDRGFLRQPAIWRVHLASRGYPFRLCHQSIRRVGLPAQILHLWSSSYSDATHL